MPFSVYSVPPWRVLHAKSWQATGLSFRGGYLFILYALPLVTLSCGLLMVSRIRYLHVFNQIFRGSKPLNYLYFSLFVVGIIALCGRELALVLTFGAFAYSGPVRWAWRKLRHIKHIPAMTHDQPAMDSHTP